VQDSYSLLILVTSAVLWNLEAFIVGHNARNTAALLFSYLPLS